MGSNRFQSVSRHVKFRVESKPFMISHASGIHRSFGKERRSCDAVALRTTNKTERLATESRRHRDWKGSKRNSNLFIYLFCSVPLWQGLLGTLNRKLSSTESFDDFQTRQLSCTRESAFYLCFEPLSLRVVRFNVCRRACLHRSKARC